MPHQLNCLAHCVGGEQPLRLGHKALRLAQVSCCQRRLRDLQAVVRLILVGFPHLGRRGAWGARLWVALAARVQQWLLQGVGKVQQVAESRRAAAMGAGVTSAFRAGVRCRHGAPPRARSPACPAETSLSMRWCSSCMVHAGIAGCAGVQLAGTSRLPSLSPCAHPGRHARRLLHRCPRAASQAGGAPVLAALGGEEHLIVLVGDLRTAGGDRSCLRHQQAQAGRQGHARLQQARQRQRRPLTPSSPRGAGRRC